MPDPNVMQPVEVEKRPWWAEDIRQAWKWAAVQIGALVTIAPELYNSIDVFQKYLTPVQMLHLMSLLGVLSVMNAVRNKEAVK